MKMERMKQLIEKRKEKMRKQSEENIISEFMVVERGGALWITHNGIAFEKIDRDATAYDVTVKLENARKTALTFAKL